MKALRCRIGQHDWSATVRNPVVWTDFGTNRDAHISYRNCIRCGKWQRADFWTGRFTDSDQPNGTEVDPGIPPDLRDR